LASKGIESVGSIWNGVNYLRPEIPKDIIQSRNKQKVIWLNLVASWTVSVSGKGKSLANYDLFLGLLKRRNKHHELPVT